jgi:dTDP-4-amino-4,6-dideoxygalactose transaminase
MMGNIRTSFAIQRAKIKPAVGEIVAAFLWAQMQAANDITQQRLTLWEKYHSGLADFEQRERLRRPIIPQECTHNAHMYYVLLPEYVDRQKVLSQLKDKGILSVFHYVPLHSSPAGKKFSRAAGKLEMTTGLSKRLIRLPLWVGMTDDEFGLILSELSKTLG